MRGGVIAAQDGQQFLVRADEEGLVAVAEPGATARRMASTRVRADSSLMARPFRPPPGLTVSRATSSGSSPA
ncbi:MAG TPA: hypothetical protein VIH64_04795 [Streptosporangiaceae bacterium]